MCNPQYAGKSGLQKFGAARAIIDNGERYWLPSNGAWLNKEKRKGTRHAAIFNWVCYGQSPETKSVHSIHFSQSQREANWRSRSKARENVCKNSEVSDFAANGFVFPLASVLRKMEARRW